MTAAGELDTVLCDVGDVVIRFDRSVAAGIEAEYGLPPGSLLPTALKSSAGRLAMTGQITYEQWRIQTAAVVGTPAVAQWLAYHGELDYDVVEQLRLVKNEGRRVVLLSNATSRLWDDLEFHALTGLADKVWCSADIGLAKPDPGCFHYAAQYSGFELCRTLYIDDTPAWVEAGQALGLTGHVFTTAQGLREDLLDLGLLR